MLTLMNHVQRRSVLLTRVFLLAVIGAVALLAGTPSNAAAQSNYSHVKFEKHTSRVGEDAGTLNLRVNFTPAPSAATTLEYEVTGTATSGSDFTALPGTVNVPANARSVVIPVTITDDTVHENTRDETIIVRLKQRDSGDHTMWPVTTTRHWIYVRDNDTPTVSFATSFNLVTEGGTKNVRVNLDPAPKRNITVNYRALYGTARNSDVSGLTGTVTANANATHVNIPVTAVSDSDRGIEYLHLQL